MNVNFSKINIILSKVAAFVPLTSTIVGGSEFYHLLKIIPQRKQAGKKLSDYHLYLISKKNYLIRGIKMIPILNLIAALWDHFRQTQTRSIPVLRHMGTDPVKFPEPETIKPEIKKFSDASTEDVREMQSASIQAKPETTDRNSSVFFYGIDKETGFFPDTKSIGTESKVETRDYQTECNPETSTEEIAIQAGVGMSDYDHKNVGAILDSVNASTQAANETNSKEIQATQITKSQCSGGVIPGTDQASQACAPMNSAHTQFSIATSDQGIQLERVANLHIATETEQLNLRDASVGERIELRDAFTNHTIKTVSVMQQTTQSTSSIGVENRIFQKNISSQTRPLMLPPQPVLIHRGINTAGIKTTNCYTQTDQSYSSELGLVQSGNIKQLDSEIEVLEAEIGRMNASLDAAIENKNSDNKLAIDRKKALKLYQKICNVDQEASDRDITNLLAIFENSPSLLDDHPEFRRFAAIIEELILHSNVNQSQSAKLENREINSTSSLELSQINALAVGQSLIKDNGEYFNTFESIKEKPSIPNTPIPDNRQSGGDEWYAARMKMGKIGTDVTGRESVFKLFQESAKLGFDKGRFWLAKCYLDGYGVCKNEEEGMNLLNELVLKGDKQSIDEIKNRKLVETPLKTRSSLPTSRATPATSKNDTPKRTSYPSSSAVKNNTEAKARRSLASAGTSSKTPAKKI